MRISLQEELDQLEASLQEEGALVLRALRGCLNALSRQDAELADEVIAFDDEVDPPERLRLELPQFFLELLPASHDLSPVRGISRIGR